jgi:mannose-1-phosphate guanylyltransferase
MRNQGPATGFAAASLIKAGLGDEPMMLIQADLLRQPEEKFLAMIDVCDKLAREGNKYITGGVKPPYAIMGIDYMIAGNKVVDGETKVFEVDKFLWRDSKEKVEEYVNSGKAMTHWNHTTMTPNNLLALIKKYKMEWYEPLLAIANGANPVEEYAKMPKGPIEDVTQNAFNNGEALVVELPYECVDFGTWESLINYQLSITNYELKGVEIEAKNNFVRSKKFTALIGVEDLVVVETDDALLICPKNKTGKVGEIVDRLKLDGKTELL